MAFCDKCGAYIPIGETACPACGYDPEEEARKAKEAEEAEARRRAEEEAKQQAEAQAAAARKRAEEDAEARRKAQAESWAAQQRKQEDARRRAEQVRQRQQYYTGGAAQSQYASQRTGQSKAYQSQYTSQRTGSSQQWAPPWQETRNHGNAQSQSTYQGYTGSQSQQYADMREKAADSVANQKLSILSYIPWVPTFLIPLLARKDDDFARYHANQGLSLFLVTAAASALEPVSGLFPLVGLGFGVYCMVKGIRNVLSGKKEPLPLIGNWKLIK